ncbi:MAG: hypothetical protein HQL42_20060 [Alphaproteobacteria bacterium]|nr:hypothetical protein [Alphaproteobacteria bacterium]
MTQVADINTTSDPVGELGRRIAAIVAAMNRNEEDDCDADGADRFRRMEELHHLQDRLNATAAMATEMKATTAVGAMLQVMLAYNAAGTILGRDQSAEYPDPYSEEMCRRIARCLYSALGILAEVSGINPAEVGGDYYMPSEFDPLAGVAKALAA